MNIILSCFTRNTTLKKVETLEILPVTSSFEQLLTQSIIREILETFVDNNSKLNRESQEQVDYWKGIFFFFLRNKYKHF
jgi:hypothetical protein